MPKIRDLGINAIPESRTRPGDQLDGLFAACPDQSHCPGQSECPGQSGHCEPCSIITEPCGCTNPSGPCGNCTNCTNDTPVPEKKPKALTHDAVAQLQYQLQQKIAAVTEAGAGQANLTI